MNMSYSREKSEKKAAKKSGGSRVSAADLTVDLFKGGNGLDKSALEKARAANREREQKRLEQRRKELLKRRQAEQRKPVERKDGGPRQLTKDEKDRIRMKRDKERLLEKQRENEEKKRRASMKPKEVQASARHENMWKNIQKQMAGSTPKSTSSKPRKNQALSNGFSRKSEKTKKHSFSAPKPRRDYISEDDLSEDDEEEEDDFIDDSDEADARPRGRHEPEQWRQEIERMKKRPAHRPIYSDDEDFGNDDDDDDDDDAGFESLIREEERSAKIAKAEDKRELKKEMQRKKLKLERKQGRPGY